MEFGKFRRGDRDDRGGTDRPRSGDREDRGGTDRQRFGDREGGDRSRFGGSGGGNRSRFGGSGGGGGDRSRYERSDRGSSDRPRFDRGGGGDRGGDRGERSGGFDRETEESVFSKKVRAGKRRTYFFDVRKTRGEDYFITITESTRREDGFGYKRHKIFLYKEDFNRFVASLNEVVNHVKTDLMPTFDYEEFDRRQAEWEAQNRNEDEEFDGGDREETPRAEDDDFAEKEDEATDDRKPEKEDDDVSW